MNNRKKIGSRTAKGGFKNEKLIALKFKNWKRDNDAKTWLNIMLSLMGYNTNDIDKIEVINIPPSISEEDAIKWGISKEKYHEEIKYKKADIQIRLKILIQGVWYIENISLKKAKANAGFNQVDKRPVDTYQSMWHFDDEIKKWLKLFTGEYDPLNYSSIIDYNSLRDKRRVSFKEMPDEAKNKIIKFFNDNKTLVVCDILKGRGGLSADWFLVTKEKENGDKEYILKDINFVLNYYAQGDVKVSNKGSLKIGKVTMQRKGGTPDPTSLQFKINPLLLFDV